MRAESSRACPPPFAEYRDSYTVGAFADTVLTPETMAKRH